MSILATRPKAILLSDSYAASEAALHLFMANLSEEGLVVLEELFFQPTRISLAKFSESFDFDIEKLIEILESFEKVELIRSEEGFILVDKDVRRQLEVRVLQLEEDFIPDFAFLEQLLRKAPIESLIHWYPIPKGSENFFSGIVERYLATPALYLRHLREVSSLSPLYEKVIERLLDHPEEEIPLSEMGPSCREELSELVIALEFYLIGTTRFSHKKEGGEECFTLFREPKEFLILKKTPKKSLIPLIPTKSAPLAFTEDMAALLAQKELASQDAIYQQRLVDALTRCRYVFAKSGKLDPTPLGLEWASLDPERRALGLTRNPHYNYPFTEQRLASEKNLREVEKQLVYLHDGWLSARDFIELVAVNIEDPDRLKLKKSGKEWSYHLPPLTQDQKLFVAEMIEGPLFEGGLIYLSGTPEDRYLKITPFGRSIYPEISYINS